MPFTAPDLPGLERAMVDGAGFRRVTTRASEEAVRRTLAEAAAPYRRADGSYLLRSRVRFIVARAWRA